MDVVAHSNAAAPSGIAVPRATVVQNLVIGKDASGISRRTRVRYGSKMCELFKEFLTEKTRELVQSAERDGAGAMTQFYSCDGTPMQTRESYFSHNVKRRTKWSREWLVERQLTSDGRRVAAMFSDGRLLQAETTTDIGAAALELSTGLLREEGFSGIASTLYVQDRGKQSDKALRRFWLRRHIHIYKSGRLPRFEVSLDILELIDWPLHVGCSLHDAHNAGEKGMVVVIERGKDFVDHLRNITVALRGGYGFLTRLSPSLKKPRKITRR
eukprot:g20831.t1